MGDTTAYKMNPGQQIRASAIQAAAILNGQMRENQELSEVLELADKIAKYIKEKPKDEESGVWAM